jgi:hypothetical protein
MIINNIKIVKIILAKDGKSLSGTCKIDATYSDGVSVSEDMGDNFQMHAFINTEGFIESRSDAMIGGSETDALWLAVSTLSKDTLRNMTK